MACISALLAVTDPCYVSINGVQLTSISSGVEEERISRSHDRYVLPERETIRYIDEEKRLKNGCREFGGCLVMYH